MHPGTVLIAHLFVNPGRMAEFRQFETAAARIMRRYGGRIERVIRPTAAPEGQPLPDEVHVVSFPSRERFEAYRQDPELAGLAALRRSAIARTEVMVGEAGAPYLAEAVGLADPASRREASPARESRRPDA